MQLLLLLSAVAVVAAAVTSDATNTPRMYACITYCEGTERGSNLNPVRCCSDVVSCGDVDFKMLACVHMLLQFRCC